MEYRDLAPTVKRRSETDSENTEELFVKFCFGILSFALFSWVFSIPAAEFKIGKEFYGEYVSDNVKAGTIFRWAIYVPNTYDPEKPAALYVGHDGLNLVHARKLEELSSTGEAPVTVCIGLASGSIPPTLEGGSPRNMRAEEYDEPGPGYPDFLVEEFIPRMIRDFHLNIDPNPNMHMISGSSSGGISAWNACWYRNDYFRRCYLCSPSFLAIRGGEDFLYRVRISEPRPMRLFVTYAEDEPNLYAGDSSLAALFAKDTFEYAGYPIRSKYIPGGEHGAGYTDPDLADQAMKYLWENWQTEPVRPLRQQERLDRLVEFGTAWEETNDPFPAPVPAKAVVGTYGFDGGLITLTDLKGNLSVVNREFEEVTGLAVSTDGWRLYVADRQRRFLYSLSINPDGSLGKAYTLAPLRLPLDIRTLGANAICVDTKDRVYAATPLGIQTCVSFGVIDAILPLPGDLRVDNIAFGGEEHQTLYVRSEGKVFRRPMKTIGKTVDFPITSPGTFGYYDGD